MLETSQVLEVETLLGERGGNAGLQQVERKEFTISAFSSLGGHTFIIKNRDGVVLFIQILHS